MDYRAWLGKLSVSSKALGRYQWIAKFLKLFNGYSPFPFHIDLILTLRCNLACKMCNLRQEENVKLFSAFREPELSAMEWMGIIKDIKGSFYFRPNLNLLGGEPSIYKGYLDIAAFIKQQGFRCTYTTNGTFLTRDAANIVSIGVDVIVVSIDGPREIHDSIRGPGVYENAVKGIHVMNELKGMQRKRVPQIFLACTINGDNYGHLVDVIDIARELDINYIIFYHLQFPDREIGIHNIDVGYLIGEMAEVKRKAVDNSISISFYPHLKTDQIATYYLQTSDQLGRGCISPWLRMTIMPNGTIVPCRNYGMGNVRIDRITRGSVWNNKKFRTFRKKLAKRGLFPDCGRCCRKQH